VNRDLDSSTPPRIGHEYRSPPALPTSTRHLAGAGIFLKPDKARRQLVRSTGVSAIIENVPSVLLTVLAILTPTPSIFVADAFTPGQGVRAR
jgi:hypothetical protein